MPNQNYSVNHHPIQTLLSWINSDEIAIPEIQRPFVWEPVKVRNLLDSLYKGYPVGYLIAWRNPNVRLKNGSSSIGKRILIDGQQRITALMAALLGKQVINKDYDAVSIRVAFNPGEETFEVTNPAIQKDCRWVPDVTTVFSPDFKILKLVDSYCSANEETNKDIIYENLERLRGIVNNPIGLIELNSDLSIEEVTNIFIRVNSMGTELSQADFVMSKIASNEIYQGNILRKAIDYFCHMAVTPGFYAKIRELDPEFVSTEFFPRMTWLKNEIDGIYDPSYTDMLRVAFISEFKRGRLQDLVALLSGRNFETKQYEERIAQNAFAQLKNGVLNFMNETHFKRFVMIIRSAGFIAPSLIGSQNALNFSYVIYLALRGQGKRPAEIEHAVRRWFVMSLLTGRYSGSPETTFDYDIRQINEQGFNQYANAVISAELSEPFWDSLLPQEMNTSSAISPYFRVYQASQVKMNDKGFLSRDITVSDLILNRSDVHHLFPRGYLKNYGITKGGYNQIANYALAQNEINITIGDKAPSDYFKTLFDQCNGLKKRIGGIVDIKELKRNLEMHCIPDRVESMSADNYEDFLIERRKLMAQKIRSYFNAL
jgi:hypothetical protein